MAWKDCADKATYEAPTTVAEEPRETEAQLTCSDDDKGVAERVLAM